MELSGSGGGVAMTFYSAKPSVNATSVPTWPGQLVYDPDLLQFQLVYSSVTAPKTLHAELLASLSNGGGLDITYPPTLGKWRRFGGLRDEPAVRGRGREETDSLTAR